MLCQECGKKPAKLHFTKFVQGEKTEFHICEVCALEKGEGIPGLSNGFSIHSLLSGLIDFNPPPSPSGLSSPPKPSRCERCGLTYAQFSKLGRFGCSNCYEEFADKLDPLFKRIHGNTVHSGKIPKRVGYPMKTKREIEQLRRELTRLIEREDFEGAARTRDQIRDLERQLNSM